MPKLDVCNVSQEYQQKRHSQPVPALQEINFSIEAGRFVAIVGPSGCGKTTLLNLIAGLRSPTSGQISWNEQVIRQPGHDCAMVFQSPALLPWRTIVDNVIYGLEIKGCHRQTARQRAQYFIDLVGLQGFEESFPHELSGGMQQRVNLARALAISPSLLLLDEPLSALDAQSREYMQGEIQRIWLETGNTALYVTHQISEAIFLADQVIVMSPRPGQIRSVIPIPFARPRPLSLKRQPDFLAIEDKIWQLLMPPTSAPLPTPSPLRGPM
ncbi:ABC transporter ATP-binding protein [filamentous cyanobacterium LEGE 11480]|uniref:ABC transporter ATP-binding protein n=1 Tax=Romeriopsis navalis LEGE 11480 TaxID=2777977 RepID=A0A928VPS9_9CYAN|nr:ABC transporter ATP-binding protein [Romeriopsis navalis]MBE9030671.1 ABC transporter ATP-binding protein [Romeriopsis navalis LEGE 11480]